VHTSEYSNNSVLLVDDESSILRALKRTLMPLKCQIFLAESADQALQILDNNDIDLIISDMRMPGTNGDKLLAQAALKHPDSERIILSGYSDAQATINAINNGAISRFILKPWDDDELVKIVRKCFKLATLNLRNEALEKLAAQRAIALEELNKSLESKVAQRTEQLEKNNSELNDSYRSIVKMFSSMIASRLVGQNTNQANELNPILLKIAEKFEIEGIELKQLLYAWQLRFLGKLSFSDELLQTPYIEMSATQQRQFQRHPLLSQAACLSVKPMYSSGQLLLQHREYLDGSGYPRGLSSDSIDFRAQIICVLSDYHALVSGLYKQHCYSSEQALEYLTIAVPERYNQQVVTELSNQLNQLAHPQKNLHDQLQDSSELVNGMRLSRDIVTATGCLLLSAGQVLDEVFINRVREMERNLEETLNIYISL